jgi:ADP-heptose:LPS heptosyltransferase
MRLKDLELAWRRLWIRALTRRLASGGHEGVPDWRRARVLFLRHDRIGDMILSTGLLRAIAEAHPGIAIDVLASPANAPVLEHDPAVARTIVFRRGGIGAYPRIVRALRATRYDAVIDCMVTAPSLTTLLLMWASGARHRVGVSGRGNDAAYTLLVPPLPWGTHMVERLGSLARAFGVDPSAADLAPALSLTDVERTRGEAEWLGEGPGVSPSLRLLVNVSAGRGHRFWPDERFVETVRRATQARLRPNILVIASPDERPRAESVAAALGGRAVATPSVRDAFALVATADAVLTPDTSIAHAASALKRPCVAMYVFETSEEWGLYGTCGTNVVSPIRDLAALEVEPVASALRDLLDDVSGETARVL